MFITPAIANGELSTANFDSSWAYSWARGSLFSGVEWSSTSFPSIGSSFKCHSKRTSLSPFQIH